MSLKSVIDQFGNNVKKQHKQTHFLPSYTHNALCAAGQRKSCLDCLHQVWKLLRLKEFSACKPSSLWQAHPKKFTMKGR